MSKLETNGCHHRQHHQYFIALGNRERRSIVMGNRVDGKILGGSMPKHGTCSEITQIRGERLGQRHKGIYKQSLLIKISPILRIPHGVFGPFFGTLLEYNMDYSFRDNIH